MKKSLRFLVLALVVLMILPLVVACKGNGDDPKKTTDPNKVVSDPSTDSLLPAKDWDGDEFLILGRSSSYASISNFEIARDNMPGDVVGDAVWTRNQNLKDKYNFVIAQELVTDTAQQAQTLYDAQDDVYDLVIYIARKVFTHASSGYLLDLNDVDYINYDHNAWNKDINASLTIGGRLYAATSKFLLQDKARTYTLFYNRDLARQYEMGQLESLVDANQWTLEKYETLARELMFDIDGGGMGGEKDSFGIAAGSRGEDFVALLYGAGFTLGTNDGETIKLTGPTLAMSNIITEAGKIWFDKNLRATPQDFAAAAGTAVDYDSAAAVFCDQRALFFSGMPSDYDSSLNKGANFEIGVLPFPKLDAAQERYYNFANVTNTTLFTIPYTVSDSAQIGFYLQAVSEESCTTTYPAYIDTKCKVQDAYDELTAKYLDMSFQNVTYDVVTCLDPGGIYTIIRDSITQYNRNAFISLYNAKGDLPQITLQEYIDAFEANG